MFLNAHCATYISLVVSAIAVYAQDPSISLDVAASGPHIVNGVDKFIVTTSITNNGDSKVTVLKDPGSPSSSMPTDKFSITGDLGNVPTFIGVRVKYIPAEAIKSGEDAVIDISPRQTVQVNHDLSRSYAFHKEGEYTVMPHNYLYIVNDKKQAVMVDTTTRGYTAILTGRLSVRQLTQRSPSYEKCNDEQKALIVAATEATADLTNNAYKYLISQKSETLRYKTWFGTFTEARNETVTTAFHSIITNEGSFANYKYICEHWCERGVFAWVYPEVFGIIHLCPPYWERPLTGEDSKAGTLVHEASHFVRNGGTQDYAFEHAGCKRLAIKNPDKAIHNADNYQYFAENQPPLP